MSIKTGRKQFWEQAKSCLQHLMNKLKMLSIFMLLKQHLYCMKNIDKWKLLFILLIMHNCTSMWPPPPPLYMFVSLYAGSPVKSNTVCAIGSIDRNFTFIFQIKICKEIWNTALISMHQYTWWKSYPEIVPMRL